MQIRFRPFKLNTALPVWLAGLIRGRLRCQQVFEFQKGARKTQIAGVPTI